MATTTRKTKSVVAIPRQMIIFLLKCYQWVISPLLGPRCRFYPSCSQYAVEAINSHGVLRGAALGAKRLCKCHPGHPGGIDEVPPVFDTALDNASSTKPLKHFALSAHSCKAEHPKTPNSL